MQSTESISQSCWRSSVECSDFFFHRNISLSYSLSCRSDRSCTPYTSYLGRLCLILTVLLREVIGLGSDLPVIRACHSFLELDDQKEGATQLFASRTLGLWLGHSPCVAAFRLFLTYLAQCQCQCQCYSRSYTSFQTDRSLLSAPMIFITTLASWAALMRSTLFP